MTSHCLFHFSTAIPPPFLDLSLLVAAFFHGLSLPSRQRPLTPRAPHSFSCIKLKGFVCLFVCLQHGLPGNGFISSRVTQQYHSGVCIYFTYGYWHGGMDGVRPDGKAGFLVLKQCFRTFLP